MQWATVTRHTNEGVEKATEPIYKKNSGVGKRSTERYSIIKSHKTLESPCTVHLRYLSTVQINMLQKLPEEHPHLLKEKHIAFMNWHNRRRWIDIIADILYCILNIVFILFLYSFFYSVYIGLFSIYSKYLWERSTNFWWRSRRVLTWWTRSSLLKSFGKKKKNK